MKNSLHILLFASFISAMHAIAQPTLTATGINPAVGDQITGNNANYVSPGNAGANQTWDVSMMTSSGVSTSTYITPASTPYASSFPNANLAINEGSGSYAYYKTSSSAWQIEGDVNGTPVVMSYFNPEDLLRFPFTYTNNYTDTWATTFISGGVTFYRTGIDSVTADSYGTLKTPNGTYSNVLRVHFVQHYQDSAYFGGNPSLSYYYNDEYLWFLNGNHNPIALVFTLTINGGNPIQSGSYMNNVSGINEYSALVSFGLFPNPSSDYLNVTIGLNEKQKVEIKLFNSIGAEVIIPVSSYGVQGENGYKINIQNLPEGIYFAKIILNGTCASTRRFVVSK